MPTLSILKRSVRDSPQQKLQKLQQNGDASNGKIDESATDSEGSSLGRPAKEKQIRNSKRDLLHDLINRSLRIAGGRSFSAPQQRGAAEPQRATAPRLSARSAESSPLSPRSLANPNKPLPSPPPPGSEQAVGPPAPKPPVLRLARIMSTLSEGDVEKLFSGAPQFFARAEGHHTGAPHPSAAYPWDEALEIRDLTDHVQIEDEAWSCVTAWPHLVRDGRGRGAVAAGVVGQEGKASGVKKRAHFYPRCRERPNMLSMQGLEKGTIGYQAALEMAVADALQEEQFGFDSLGSKGKVIIEARQKLMTSKDGLRHVEETRILDELIKNGQRYLQNDLGGGDSSTKLYNELFKHLMHPPTRAIDHNDPHSLSGQIQVLLKVLAAHNVWVDFSRVEWRIRLGQILWATSIEDDVDDGASIQDTESAGERHEERYWLLLQILLACELLIRLDAITEGDELGTESIRPAEINRFEKEANESVKWSLILARAWLENIEIVKTEPIAQGVTEEHVGWLATLSRRMSLSSETMLHPLRHHGPVYAMKGKHGERQVRGLTHFAKKLRWPGIENHASRVTDICRAVTDGTPLNTPLASPMITTDTQRSSYFGGAANASHQLKRQPSRRRKVGAALHPAGWLSKSYISGLMLPGEGICHFLMSTLLENDKEAMSKLGNMANLCGGFTYEGKSFWSVACVVGRVLAAGRGSSECMGWISSDVTPKDLGDGWVNIEVEELRDDVLLINKRARLWGKATVERESSVLGDADPSSVLPADFIVPSENIYREPVPAAVKIELKSLNLTAPVSSVQATPLTDDTVTPYSDASTSQELQSYHAAITFAVTKEDETASTEYTYSLANDINFVTAHPCLPSQHVRILKSPSSPTIQQIDVTGDGLSSRSASPVHVTGHPLHKYYTYTAVQLADLLTKQTSSLDQLLTSYDSTAPRPSQTPATHKMPKVLVIDCITGFAPQPTAAEVPVSPTSPAQAHAPPAAQDASPPRSVRSFGLVASAGSAAAGEAELDKESKMHSETRRREFGSDMEVLVRALCAEKGWNAIISRRRRGCLGCAIREAGALGWKVVVRVD